MTTNLVKKYGLNEEDACPLLLEYRERGFLRHQTREFIVSKAVDEQTWADNVESVVRFEVRIIDFRSLQDHCLCLPLIKHIVNFLSRFL